MIAAKHHAQNWEITDEELATFVAGLTDERRAMSLSLEQLRSSEVIVAYRVDGMVIGIAGVRRVHRLAVAFFIVMNRFHGRGFGTALVRNLHVALKRLHYRIVFLSVQRENTRAVHIYRSNGYAVFMSTRGKFYMFRLI